MDLYLKHLQNFHRIPAPQIHDDEPYVRPQNINLQLPDIPSNTPTTEQTTSIFLTDEGGSRGEDRAQDDSQDDNVFLHASSSQTILPESLLPPPETEEINEEDSNAGNYIVGFYL